MSRNLLYKFHNIIYINNNKYLALQDSCSQVTVCHPGIVPKENMLDHENISIKGIGSKIVALPMAKIPVRYKGWSGIWKVTIPDQIPAPCLIGLDFAEHVQSVFVTTCSQGRHIEAAEENDGNLLEGRKERETADLVNMRNPNDPSFIQEEQKEDCTLSECFAQVKEIPLTPENPERCPSSEENPETAEMAEVVILENRNNTSRTDEQKEDSTLNDCITKANESPIPLTPEHPEKFIGVNLIYREVLSTPHRIRDGHNKQLSL